MRALKNMNRTTRSNFITYGIVLAFYLVMQGLLSGGLLSNAVKGMLVPVCAYVVLAVSLNLTVGILGELSLGHAGFMGIGAFSGAVFWMLSGSRMPLLVGMPLAMLIGGVMAGIFGFLIGVPVLRLQGDYLAIVTLAFGQIIKSIINSLYLGKDSRGLHIALTDASNMHMEPDGQMIINGAIGITGMRKASTFTAGFLLVMLTLIVILNLINSRTGRAVMSIRDNRIAAEATGINVTKYKLIAFITSAVFAGMAGVLYALNFSTLAVKKFDYNTSIMILVFVVMGGIGSIRGSVIAVSILYVLPEMLRGLADYRMLIYACVLILMMIFNQSPRMVEWRERLVKKIQARGALSMGERKKKGRA